MIPIALLFKPKYLHHHANRSSFIFPTFSRDLFLANSLSHAVLEAILGWTGLDY